MKGSDAARYVNDAITFERSIFRENAIFKMLPSLRRSCRCLQLDAQLCVVAGLVVTDTQTDTHTHTQTKYRNPRACPDKGEVCIQCVCSLSSPLQPNTDISAYTYERTLIMEQRNEMLQKMRMTDKQKKGDIQHLLAKSFSTRQISIPLTPTSPPGEISIPVPQLPHVHIDPPPTAQSAAVSLGDVTMDTSSSNNIAMTTITEELGVVHTGRARNGKG